MAIIPSIVSWLNSKRIDQIDLFKKYPVDIDLEPVFFKKKLPLLLRKLIYKFTGFDIVDFETYFKIKRVLPKLKGFDVVQLINEDALVMHPTIQIPLLKQIFSQNKYIYLLCCGDDYVTINYYLNNKGRYSILTPYLKEPLLKNKFAYSLKYTTKPYKKLHDFISKYSQGTITTDLDYHIPFTGRSNYLGLIPNPINIKSIPFVPFIIDSKIVIFHGINTLSVVKKGTLYFEEALKIIQEAYPDKVLIITSKNIPYSEYIESYNSAHILLDQVFSYDQGYNALEAMAKGKIVFTGAEQEWLDYYNIKEDSVAINALPDANKIAEKLEWLILNPEKIIEISKNARQFIEKEHDYIQSTEKYLEMWKTNR